ncbi:MAG TPA: hypothetical protein ENF51_01085 [Candidatus Aenigmarchaeota archaeon]|nr:hypothetical protein [Candidatus Aenigmarchaeota archaeon]
MRLLEIGILTILLGFFITFLALLREGETKFAIGGFIGPIPFGFANEPSLLLLVIILVFFLMIVFLLLQFLQA